MTRLPFAVAVLASALVLVACNRRKEPLTPQAPAWVVEQVDGQAKQVSPAAEPVTPAFREIAFKRNAYKRWTIRLTAGHCYLISTVGDETVQTLYMRLWTPRGKRVIKSEQPAPGMVSEYCPESEGMYELEVKIARGHGHYVTRVFSKEPGAPDAMVMGPPTAPPPPAATEATTATTPAPPPPGGDPVAARIAQMGSANPGAEPLGDLREGAGDLTDWYVALETGKCYWFIAAGGAGIEELSLFAWDPNKKRVGTAKGNGKDAQLGHCPDVAGMHRVQAKVAKGSGRYALGVYAKAR